MHTMYCLGQSVSYRNLASDPWSPAVITGFTKTGTPVISTITPDGELHQDKDVFFVDISYMRQPAKDSPTGKRIYYGTFYKRGVGGKGTKLVFAKHELPSLVKELKYVGKMLDKK